MQKIKPFHVPIKEPCRANILEDTPSGTAEGAVDSLSHYRKIRESLHDNTAMNLYLCSSGLSDKAKASFTKEGVKKYV